MTHLPALEGLIERLSNATGPDRALDLLLAQALVPDVVVLRRNDDDTGNEPHTYWEYTGSVDAALALAERVLPGYRWGVSQAGIRTGKHPDGKTAYSDGFKAHVTEASPLRPMPTIAEARTASLALILATLKALSRIKGDHNDEA